METIQWYTAATPTTTFQYDDVKFAGQPALADGVLFRRPIYARPHGTAKRKHHGNDMVDGSAEFVGEMENLRYVSFGFVTCVYWGYAWEQTDFTTRRTFL